MGRVGQFVGIDPNEAAFDSPPEPSQVFEPIGFGRAAKRFVQTPPKPAQEGVGADGLHFDNQRLAFVRRHSGRLTDRLARIGRW